GRPRLLTLRGAEVLQRADVVVYDRLAPAALLDLAPRGAERIDAGKARGRAALSQEAINRGLVDRGRRGLEVVRLKGGDPFVFGRGGEEALALAEAGVPFEVVPGVSAAVAAPAYAGIPVTHRGLAASYAVISATLAGGAPADLARTAAAADTLVLLMAAERLGEVCAQPIPAGGPAAQPAAATCSASTPRHRRRPPRRPAGRRDRLGRQRRPARRDRPPDRAGRRRPRHRPPGHPGLRPLGRPGRPAGLVRPGGDVPVPAGIRPGLTASFPVPGLPLELTQDVLEDATVAVVLDLVGGVDPDPAGELVVVGADGDLAGEAVGAGTLQAGDLEGLVAGEAEGLDRLAGRQLQGQDAHADQVGPVDALVAL